MGKPTGFMEYKRQDRPTAAPAQRVTDFEEFHGELPLQQRQLQGARCMNCGVPFCQSDFGCPLHNLIPEWNDEVFQGNWEHALDRLLKTNNFPEFTGRVCPALCESACVCGLYGDAPISVRDNELAVIEYAYEHGLVGPKTPAVRTGKKVAVVGSGPAGLAVADQLNHRGHSVTVFERDDRVGGLLMYGIPNMKLDKAVVKRRTDRMTAEGVRFITSFDVAAESAAKRLMQVYDAVVLCCGARQARTVPVEGASPDMVQALDYLAEATRALLDGRESACSAKGRDVVVVGNGDTATDCVATAVRQGAASVTQLVRKPAAPAVPAVWPYHVRSGAPDYGQEEAAVKFGSDPRRYDCRVKRLVTDSGGALTALEIDAAGQLRSIPAQLLLVAAGFAGAEAPVTAAFGLTLDEKGRVLTGADGFSTEREKVFAAGDMCRGASLVAVAIAEGRACARAVDAFLEGYTNL